MSPSRTRLLITRAIKTSLQDKILRFSLYDTQSLEELGFREWLRAPTADDLVFSKGGLLGTVDFPLSREPGRYPCAFPEAFRECGEILTPIAFSGPGRWRVTQLVCVARPGHNEIQLIRLPWWDGMSYGQVIDLLTRDSRGGNFVARAVGSKPFVLSPDGEFAGWL